VGVIYTVTATSTPKEDVAKPSQRGENTGREIKAEDRLEEERTTEQDSETR